jgi:hypothetical protein
MAKLIGPLLSETAHGKIARVLTFSLRSSGNQVRYQRAQKDYSNNARAAQRTIFQTVIAWWHQMTAAEKLGFDGYDVGDF